MVTRAIHVRQCPGGTWIVELEDVDDSAISYPTRGAAIAAGVKMAMEHDLLLFIHGLERKPTRPDLEAHDEDAVRQRKSA